MRTECIPIHHTAIKTCHWIRSSHFNCLMTGSWDKTVLYLPYLINFKDSKALFTYIILQVKFWNLGAQQPIGTLQLPVLTLNPAPASPLFQQLVNKSLNICMILIPQLWNRLCFLLLSITGIDACPFSKTRLENIASQSEPLEAGLVFVTLPH